MTILSGLGGWRITFLYVVKVLQVCLLLLKMVHTSLFPLSWSKDQQDLSGLIYSYSFDEGLFVEERQLKYDLEQLVQSIGPQKVPDS